MHAAKHVSKGSSIVAPTQAAQCVMNCTQGRTWTTRKFCIQSSLALQDQQQGAALSEAAVQHLLGHSVDGGMAWAGAAHWRYRTRAATKPASSAQAGEAAEDALAAKPAAR